jgi:hypothetical protein
MSKFPCKLPRILKSFTTNITKDADAHTQNANSPIL